MIIVGVCGASGSGKSTLARRIKEALSCSCEIIGQDCYYRSFPEIPFEERVHLNYDEPTIFNYDEMIEDLKTLSEGKPITKKGYNYARHLREDSTDLIYPPEVLILEGILSTCASCAVSSGISRAGAGPSRTSRSSISPR